MTQEEQEKYAAFLKARRQEIVERIASAAERAGRDPSEITLLAVSKTVGPDEVFLAWQEGYHAFGENRPQELKHKLAGAAQHPEMAAVRFDMIGNLQTNKINQVVGNVALIHSVSSEHLAQAISKRSQTHGVSTRFLMEVNVSGEESKSGFAPQEALEAAKRIAELPNMELCGLMTMAPAGDPEAARRTFSGLRELAVRLREETGLGLPVLSCGMSDDFQIAIEEGSTLVRLGRTVFDPNYVLK